MDKQEYQKLLEIARKRYIEGSIDKNKYLEMKNEIEIEYVEGRHISGEINENEYRDLISQINKKYMGLNTGITDVSNPYNAQDNNSNTEFYQGDIVSKNYKIIRLLGEGGMAKVYLAEHQTLNKKVAIKKMLPSLMLDHSFIERFRNEAISQARLNHPNICNIIDFDSDTLSVILEYVEGTSLENYIKQKGYLKEKEALEIIQGVLDGLNYAHQKGIIHRDIKPSNILLGASNIPKITDFGIALIMGEERKTKTGVGIGTPHYMSPEQIKGDKLIDHRTDVYSTGVMLYEMLTGRTPFDTAHLTEGSDFHIKSMHINQIPQPLFKINNFIPEELSDIVLKALEKEPDNRYLGCGDFNVSIKAYLQKKPANKRMYNKVSRCGSDNKQVSNTKKVPNYLVHSILVTLFCCLPLGIPAIIFSSQVNTKFKAGDIHGAREASRKAKLFVWLAVGIGILFQVLYIFILIALGEF